MAALEIQAYCTAFCFGHIELCLLSSNIMLNNLIDKLTNYNLD